MKKLLLHVCCGPCSTHVVKSLMSDYTVTMYFYNPNVHPEGEYVRRLEAARKVSDKLNVELIEGEYTVEEWLDAIAGHEEAKEGGSRCAICFANRLEETARYAAANGFDCFTTTMTISPHKDSSAINEIGSKLAEKYSVEWVHSDFKKKDGFRKSTEMSSDMKLYRQKHCGCFYSVKTPEN